VLQHAAGGEGGEAGYKTFPSQPLWHLGWERRRWRGMAGVRRGVAVGVAKLEEARAGARVEQLRGATGGGGVAAGD
jgi:hypothetical protein